MAYLGFPGVIGASFVDFNVADPTVVPPADLQPFQPESVVYMPHCYQINSFRELYQSRKQGVTWQRKDFGLPDRTFVMCTFNRLGRCQTPNTLQSTPQPPPTRTPQDHAGGVRLLDAHYGARAQQRAVDVQAPCYGCAAAGGLCRKAPPCNRKGAVGVQVMCDV